ncbi:hypothetical protein VNI00_013651 [Paramarasmius palmivorus]|uniref:Uncharacterized protein n=1 Tax=Paramarasmius palmivorus TaxID=297713 RepID=A0AAW0BWG3_9AGAR
MLIPVNFSPSSSLTAGYPKLAPALAKVSHNEVILLEFQGEFEVETVTSDRTERDGKVVGALSIDDDLKRPTLRVGHHHLEGKVTTLAKPLAVLHRHQSSAYNPTQSQRQVLRKTDTAEDEDRNGDRNGNGNDDDDVEMEGDDTANTATKSRDSLSTSVSWDAVAIVKRKIVFSKRPLLIVGRQ